ncbi:MAG TPA: SxtJ family membrane protein [Thermoanaerobaculia bacterium]
MTSSLIESRAPERKQLVGFGLVMAAAALVLAWIHGELDAISFALIAIAVAFALAPFVAPRPLTPVYRAWMRLAELLGWINTRILLILIFYLVVTPIGLVMRIFRRSPLALDERNGTFWSDPPKHSYGDKHFEKQF